MDSLKQLALLSTEDKRARFPSIPQHCLPTPKFTDKTASGLTACVLQYIRLMGGYAVRINSQGQYNEKLGKWTKGTTAKGTADIHACLQGRHYSIEVKIGADRQSEHQMETQQAVVVAGGLYFEAKDFTSFYTWLNQVMEGQRNG